MKNVLVLFIISFLCIIFCINHFGCKYADNHIDTFIVTAKYKNYKNNTTEQITKILDSKNTITLKENHKLLITLSAATIILFVFLAAKPLFAYIFMAFFLIAYFLSYILLVDHYIFINLLAPVIAVILIPGFLKTCRKVHSSDKNSRIKRHYR